MRKYGWSACRQETNVISLNNFFFFFFLQETELFLSELVVSKTVFARIDRPAGIVTFSAHKESNEILNEWSHNLNTLMQLLNRTTHLITKEEMVHKLVQM